MRTAVCSFLGGAAVAAGAGAYYLRKSLFESSGELQVAISELAKDVNTTNKDLTTRLAKLEAKVSCIACLPPAQQQLGTGVHDGPPFGPISVVQGPLPLWSITRPPERDHEI